MPVYGLKLGIGEMALARTAETLWRRGKFEFLELYVPLTARIEKAALWAWYDGALILHGPHSEGGFNFASEKLRDSNRAMLGRMAGFVHAMRPESVVFHPGYNGAEDECLRQIYSVRQEWPEVFRVMLLENKPMIALDGKCCLGASPAEMGRLLAETGCAFCLDVRHAAAYAASSGLGLSGVLKDFVALGPRLWHAADGDTASPVDSHGHIGDGDMPWEEIAAFWDKDTPVTIECAKEAAEMLADFRRDAAELRRRTGRA